MKVLAAAILVAILAGCSAMPSFQYCDRVEYKRDGSKIKVVAECQAPVGVAGPGL